MKVTHEQCVCLTLIVTISFLQLYDENLLRNESIQGHLTDLFGEISVRMEMLAGLQTEQILHRADKSAGKIHRTNKILPESCLGGLLQ